MRRSLEKFHNNPKKLWTTIRDFWPGLKNKSQKLNKIGNNFTPKDISEAMNTHFSNVANNVLENLHDHADIPDHLPPQLLPVFEFKEITFDDISDAIKGLVRLKQLVMMVLLPS